MTVLKTLNISFLFFSKKAVPQSTWRMLARRHPGRSPLMLDQTELQSAHTVGPQCQSSSLASERGFLHNTSHCRKHTLCELRRNKDKQRINLLKTILCGSALSNPVTCGTKSKNKQTIFFLSLLDHRFLNKLSLPKRNCCNDLDDYYLYNMSFLQRIWDT